jgi:hypothetical protein
MQVNTILSQMSSLSAPQYKFMQALLAVLMSLPTRLNLRNLSRYLYMSEKTVSRWFAKSFDFVGFNQLALKNVTDSGHELIVAIDACFMRKSGKKTYGIDSFWNGSAGQSEKGLEFSEIALVDVTHNTAYHLSAVQTAANDDQNDPNYTRTDQYFAHIKKEMECLRSLKINYIVMDSFYAKKKMINGITELKQHAVGKLRYDSALYYPFQGEQKARGRPRKYGDKVNFNDLSQLEFVCEENGHKIYTAKVHSVTFKRIIRIVYVARTSTKKVSTALLFSTDVSLDARTILRYYKARFQIEFLFRDAKQFTGLNDHQVRDQKKLDFHLNLSLTALNLLRLQAYQHEGDLLKPKRGVISIASKKVRNFNEHMLKKISSMFEIDLTCIKYQDLIAHLCNYGVIAT